ncbi:HMG1/2-like protein [Triticum urartu]|uniref:HMG box domain-containing protein n=2 Tax=Triticum TaxID=4564 RepID=A0A9R0WR54_TRITD|nr:HMG1/2-like protein [Triticum urartu]VAI20901.1 unnamed protein product [Triticum turgidum subsp. durum]
MKAKAGSRAGDSRLAVKKSKAEKDPNKPKRPPSAFFVFMDTFRKEYKEKHPDVKQVSVIGKAGGEKWKSLSDAEKAPYAAKAEKLKAEYAKKIDAYNNPQAGEASGDSDKSKSEVNDEDDGSEVLDLRVRFSILVIWLAADGLASVNYYRSFFWNLSVAFGSANNSPILSFVGLLVLLFLASTSWLYLVM